MDVLTLRNRAVSEKPKPRVVVPLSHSQVWQYTDAGQYLSSEYQAPEDCLPFETREPALETALQWLWNRVGTVIGWFC